MRHGGQRMQETDPVAPRLAHADDPAAAHVDARGAHIFQRLDPVLEGPGGDDRSEEHTSELQSLMRISYAVFCLKKKTNTSPRANLSAPTRDTLDNTTH